MESENMMDYAAREQQKAEARKILNEETASLARKANALIGLIDAYYWRAREHLESLPKAEQRRIHGKRYCRGYQLDIDIYTRHWLYANGNQFAPDVIEAVQELWCYEPEESRFLHKGKTTYSLRD